MRNTTGIGNVRRQTARFGHRHKHLTVRFRPVPIFIWVYHDPRYDTLPGKLHARIQSAGKVVRDDQQLCVCHMYVTVNNSIPYIPLHIIIQEK